MRRRGNISRSGKLSILGGVTLGVVRTTYLIDEAGIIVRAFDKVKAAENRAQRQEAL